MASSNNITPGMTISLNGKLYRVESSVKVTVAKGNPFIKTKLRDLSTDEMIEKNFKLNQNINDVSLLEKRLEFLYLEGKDYLFLDVGTLDHVLVPPGVIADNVQYLKEGIEIKATLYGETVFSVELPQFLELMITKIEPLEQRNGSGNGSKRAVLETGAKIEVPPFVEVGDIIKVDTKNGEYIQRV